MMEEHEHVWDQMDMCRVEGCSASVISVQAEEIARLKGQVAAGHMHCQQFEDVKAERDASEQEIARLREEASGWRQAHAECHALHQAAEQRADDMSANLDDCITERDQWKQRAGALEHALRRLGCGAEADAVLARAALTPRPANDDMPGPERPCPTPTNPQSLRHYESTQWIYYNQDGSVRGHGDDAFPTEPA